MATKINIRKVVAVFVWGIVAAGVLTLLVAAMRYRNNNVCKGVQIVIDGSSLDRKDISGILTTGGGAKKLTGRSIQSFDLRRLESVLEKNVWIKKAQLFFDNNGILRVNVIEREPTARIFTTEGNSFYIDSTGSQLPLQDKMLARLPVFTGYPGSKVKNSDSMLIGGLLQMSSFIRQDSFWMAQVAQIHITADQLFELEPEVGDHRVTFGDGSDIQQKFHRLFLFYEQVLSRTGLDKYSRIDVSYAGQVIGIKKGSEQSRYDSIQGMNNIRQLIQSAQQLQQDTIRQQNIRPLERNTMTEQNLTNYDLVPDGADDSSASAAHPTTPPATQTIAPPANRPASAPANRPATPAATGHAGPQARPPSHEKPANHGPTRRPVHSARTPRALMSPHKP